MRRQSGSSTSKERRIRVRSRPLSEVDETKLALAVFLMAKRLVEDRTDAAMPAAPQLMPTRDDLPETGREVA